MQSVEGTLLTSFIHLSFKIILFNHNSKDKPNFHEVIFLSISFFKRKDTNNL